MVITKSWSVQNQKTKGKKYKTIADWKHEQKLEVWSGYKEEWVTSAVLEITSNRMYHLCCKNILVVCNQIKKSSYLLATVTVFYSISRMMKIYEKHTVIMQC